MQNFIPSNTPTLFGCQFGPFLGVENSSLCLLSCQVPDGSHEKDPKACCKLCPPNRFCLIMRDVSLMLFSHASFQHVRFRGGLHFTCLFAALVLNSLCCKQQPGWPQRTRRGLLAAPVLEGVCMVFNGAPNSSTQTSLTCRLRRRLCGQTCRIGNTSMVSWSSDTIFQIRQDTFCLRHACLV